MRVLQKLFKKMTPKVTRPNALSQICRNTYKKKTHIPRAKNRWIEKLENEITNHNKGMFQENDIDRETYQFLYDTEWNMEMEHELSTRMTLIQDMGDLTLKIYMNARQNIEDPSLEIKKKEIKPILEDTYSDECEYYIKENKTTEFILSIERKGEKKTLIFDLVSFNGGRIEIFKFFPANDLDRFLDIKESYTFKNKYYRPNFSKLPEDVKVKTKQYLLSLGIDKTLGRFIEKKSADFESRYYMEWLNNVRECVL